MHDTFHFVDCWQCHCQGDVLAVMPRTTSSMGVERQVKRETAKVLYNILELLRLVVSMTSQHFFEYDTPLSNFLCKSIKAKSGKMQ